MYDEEKIIFLDVTFRLKFLCKVFLKFPFDTFHLTRKSVSFSSHTQDSFLFVYEFHFLSMIHVYWSKEEAKKEEIIMIEIS